MNTIKVVAVAVIGSAMLVGNANAFRLGYNLNNIRQNGYPVAVSGNSIHKAQANNNQQSTFQNKLEAQQKAMERTMNAPATPAAEK